MSNITNIIKTGDTFSLKIPVNNISNVDADNVVEDNVGCSFSQSFTYNTQ